MIFGANPVPVLNHRCHIWVGDVFKMLAEFSDASVDCIVTSPPYWGLRDYGTAFWVEGDPNCDHVVGAATRTPWAGAIKGPNGQRSIKGFSEQSRAGAVGGTCMKCGARRADYQIGLEPTLGQHLDVMVEVFAELWRVLKPTGTVWLNYGDCYATAPNGRSAEAVKAAGQDDRTFRDKPISTIGGVLKDKDLCMIPNRLAIALQEWGWWVRSEIIWAKKNPMPDSSGRQRPSTSHEKIFLLAKSADADVWYARDTGAVSFAPDLAERCPLVTRPEIMGPRWLRLGAYYDAAAVMQESSPNTHARMAQDVAGQVGSARAHAGKKSNGAMKAVASKVKPAGSGHRNNASLDAALKSYTVRSHRRAANVGVDPRHTEHVNHTGLVDLGRGKGRLLRNYEAEPPGLPGAPLPVWRIGSEPYRGAHFATFPPELARLCIEAGCPPGGVVLDPFGGVGTTALVALRLGRRAHIIELNPGSAADAQQRIEEDWMGEEERKRSRARRAADKAPVDAGPLFTGDPETVAS